MAEYRRGGGARQSDGGDGFGNLEALLKFSALAEPVRMHLVAVYTMLSILLLSATVGCVANIYFRIPNMLLFLGSSGSLFYFMFNSSSMSESNKRSMMLVFAAFSGASLAPLVEMAAAIASEWLVLAALSCTVLIFACFSLSALLARRRSYLFLGAWLSSGVSCLFWLGLLGAMFPNRLHFGLQLYGGLLLYSGFVVYDTQLIVEKAELCFQAGMKPSVVDDAMKLFTDFIALFRRILIIMARNQQRKNEHQRRSNSYKRADQCSTAYEY